jgi:lipooligosaccharide transport system permease protein
MWYRNWKIFRKVFWFAAAPNFLEPVIYLLALGIGLGLLVQDVGGLSYVQFLAPGLLGSTVMYASSFETTYDSFIRMKYEKTYDAVLATPLSIEDVIAGEILWGTTRGYINALTFLAVISVLGYVHSPAALLLVPLLFVFAALFAIFGMIYTALVSNINLFNYYFTLFITPLFLFSGIFFPISTLPLWAQRIAYITPLYHVVLVCRGLALGQLNQTILTSIFITIALTATLFLIPIIIMKKRLIK